MSAANSAWPDSESATICAVASAVGGPLALVRLSGPQALAIAGKAGVAIPEPWSWRMATAALPQGPCPARILFAPAARSSTGCDLLELVVPGSPVVAAAWVDHLCRNGAQPADRGAFTRQALVHGRLALDQAEALLALVHAADAEAATRALDRLQGALGRAVADCRDQLLDLLAGVEAGLDFAEEDGGVVCPEGMIRAGLETVRQTCHRWRRTAADHRAEPVVCLVGPVNAGKSALFAALCGEAALVDGTPGTTRDWLEGAWHPCGRTLRLIDTPGWMPDPAASIDRSALAAAEAIVATADAVVVCFSADAPLPGDWLVPHDRCLLVATKADCGHRQDRRCRLACSAVTGAGLEDLAAAVDRLLGEAAPGAHRHQALLAEAEQNCVRLLCGSLPEDVLLAEELRSIAATLGDLIGVCTDEAVLDRIFAAFCIGK